jgi:hypothetical protein
MNRTHCCFGVTTLSIFITLLTCTYVCQKYKQDALLRFHPDDSYAKAPRCYVTRLLPILFSFKNNFNIILLSTPMSSKRWRFFGFSHRNPVCIFLHLATRPVHRVLLICSPYKCFVSRTTHDVLYNTRTISWILLLFPLSSAQMSSSACYCPMLSATSFTRYDVPICTSIQSSRHFMAVCTLIFMFVWLQTRFLT